MVFSVDLIFSRLLQNATAHQLTQTGQWVFLMHKKIMYSFQKNLSELWEKERRNWKKQSIICYKLNFLKVMSATQ